METDLRHKLKELIQHHPVQQAYLFGSHARGTAGALSDIDIAVLYDPFKGVADVEKMESALFADLSRNLQTDNIDLINIATAPPLLAHRAVLMGISLLAADPHKQAMLKTSILHAYEDTRHLRDIKYAAFV